MHEHSGGVSLMELIGFGLLLAIAVYVIAAYRSAGHGRWPSHRILAWIAGCLVAALSLQIANSRHDDFVAHAVAPVGLGLLAPLLLVLAAPVTLALRSLDVVPARRVSRLRTSWVARFLGHPIPAALLALTGSWLLYAGGIYESLHDNGLLFAAVYFFVFVSGYLFTAAIIGIDPNPHRSGYVLRAVVLCVAVAAHGILASAVVTRAPAGVPAADAAAGSLVLSCGTGAVALALAAVLGAAWIREVPRRRSAAQSALLVPSRASSDGRSTSSSSRSRS